MKKKPTTPHTPKKKQRGKGRPGTFRKGGPGGPGRRAGVPNKATVEAKRFCQGLLDSPAYQKRFQAAFIARTLTPDMEKLVWHYAAGKPATTLNVAASQDLVELLAAFSRPKAEGVRP